MSANNTFYYNDGNLRDDINSDIGACEFYAPKYPPDHTIRLALNTNEYKRVYLDRPAVERLIVFLQEWVTAQTLEEAIKEENVNA